MTDEQIKEKKPHTLKDYYALPEEHRAELIDGVFYDMAAPSLRHQSILLSLANNSGSALRNTIRLVKSISPPAMSGSTKTTIQWFSLIYS